MGPCLLLIKKFNIFNLETDVNPEEKILITGLPAHENSRPPKKIQFSPSTNKVLTLFISQLFEDNNDLVKG
jgi:hypothetical protein